MQYVYDSQLVLAKIKGQWLECIVMCACGDDARVKTVCEMPMPPKKALNRVAGVSEESQPVEVWRRVDELRPVVPSGVAPTM